MPDVTSALCLVLHAHQPYVRRHGAWPCGEDWYHQAASEAYLPLAAAFTRLAEDGLAGFATVSFTPVLAGQMADPYLTRELLLYAGRTMLRAEMQAANWERTPQGAAFVGLAAFAHRRASGLAERLAGPASGGAHTPWRELALAGAVETWTSAPTHAFLPGLRNEALMAAGFRAAASEHRRVFGVEPGGAWLPECAYRPGLEDVVDAGGLGAFLVDGPAFEAAGARVRAPARAGDSGVTVFGRDREACLLVAGPGGYPGGDDYRDFHHYDDGAGFKSFAVTGAFGPKRRYDPRAGEARARRDALRFAEEIRRRLEARPGVLVAAFDLELFGHWWYEGPVFLETLVRELHGGRGVRPATLSEAAQAFSPRDAVAPARSTWGRDGDESSWRNAATAPVWQRVRDAETALAAALGSPEADPRILAQAVREFLLLAGSDWPFMITMGRAADYARDRVSAHGAALDSLLRPRTPGPAATPAARGALEALEELDNPLPGLDLAPFRTARERVSP